MLATIAILAAEGGGEHAVEPVNPVLPFLPEVFWGALFFFALWALMRYVLLPPVRQTMREREEQKLADEEAAERAAIDAEKVRRDYDATLGEARGEASSVIDAARARGEARRAELVAEAEADAAEARRVAMEAIDAERAEALAAARPQVTELAGAAAGKVLGRSVSSTVAERAVESYFSQN